MATGLFDGPGTSFFCRAVCVCVCGGGGGLCVDVSHGDCVRLLSIRLLVCKGGEGRKYVVGGLYRAASTQPSLLYQCLRRGFRRGFQSWVIGD